MGARKRYFSESANYNARRLSNVVESGNSVGISIPVPEGWEVRSLAARLVKEGYTSYFELKQGSIKDVFEMLLLLEWNDYAQAYAEQLAKANR